MLRNGAPHPFFFQPLASRRAAKSHCKSSFSRFGHFWPNPENFLVFLHFTPRRAATTPQESSHHFPESLVFRNFFLGTPPPGIKKIHGTSECSPSQNKKNLVGFHHAGRPEKKFHGTSPSSKSLGLHGLHVAASKKKKNKKIWSDFTMAGQKVGFHRTSPWNSPNSMDFQHVRL